MLTTSITITTTTTTTTIITTIITIVITTTIPITYDLYIIISIIIIINHVEDFTEKVLLDLTGEVKAVRDKMEDHTILHYTILCYIALY